jgi:hypothetical protein
MQPAKYRVRSGLCVQIIHHAKTDHKDCMPSVSGYYGGYMYGISAGKAWQLGIPSTDRDQKHRKTENI